MGAILSFMPLLQSALAVVGAFRGDAQAAKVTGYVQDAVSVITALSPLVTQFGEGQEVTEEDVREALAGMHQALDAFDAMIAQKGG